MKKITNDEIIDHRLMLYERSEELNRAIKRFTFRLRDNKEMQEAALQFTDSVENEIARCEILMLEYNKAIKQLMKENKVLLDVMQMYGIDLGLLGSQPMQFVEDDAHDAKKHGYFVIPENIRAYVEQIEPKQKIKHTWY